MAKFKLEDGTEVEAFTKEEVESQIAGLRQKVDELLTEKKTVSQRAKELEDQQKKLEEDRQKEKGEFKSLYEKTQAELEQEREAARKFRQTIQTKELEGEALKIAAGLTRDTKRAELLKKEVLQFAKYTEEGVKFEIGGLTVTPEKLVETVKESYPFLVDGSGATGGGAAGGKSGGAAKGDFGGSPEERKAAISARFPELAQR
jgi:predicted nuclease with TOPRIM domain